MSQTSSEKRLTILDRINNRISLQTRLVLSMLFIALVPLIAVSTRNITQTQQALTNGAEISLRASALQTANSLDTFIEETLISVQIEAQFSDFSAYLALPPSERPGSLEQANARDLLEQLSGKDTVNIISYALVGADGRVLLDTVKENIQKNESGESYFSQVRFSEKPIVTDVTYSDKTTTVIHFAAKY